MFLLTSLYSESGESRGSAILLNHSPAIAFSSDDQTVWALVVPPRQVSVGAVCLSELVASEYRPDFHGELLRASENRVELVVDVACSGATPMFLSETSEYSPHHYDVVVGLNIQNIYSLADVQAYIAFSKAFEEESPFGLPESIRHGHSTRLIETAHEMSVVSGLYLPCEIETDSGRLLGCIHLKHIEPAMKCVATLYVPTPVPVNSGLVVSRVVEWENPRTKKNMAFRSRIGTIL
jgi:hypothetical protein